MAEAKSMKESLNIQIQAMENASFQASAKNFAAEEVDRQRNSQRWQAIWFEAYQN